MSERTSMPIQASKGLKPLVRSVPWAVVAGGMSEDRCKLNHSGQTLERIAQRHGFSACEALWVICNMPANSSLDNEQAQHRLLYMMTAIYRRGVIEGARTAATKSNPETE